jgi:hypothetical protein
VTGVGEERGGGGKCCEGEGARKTKKGFHRVSGGLSRMCAKESG